MLQVFKQLLSIMFELFRREACIRRGLLEVSGGPRSSTGFRWFPSVTMPPALQYRGLRQPKPETTMRHQVTPAPTPARAAFAQAGYLPLMVVVLDVGADTLADDPEVVVGVQADVFMFEALPEALDRNLVPPTALSVRADAGLEPRTSAITRTPQPPSPRSEPSTLNPTCSTGA